MRNAVTTLMVGAGMMLSVAGWSEAAPTYTKDVAPILNQNCVTCHRPGEIAPMSLTSYEEVRPWVKSIVRNVEERKMPPWHADPALQHEFANDRSLEQSEIDTIVAWANSGAKRGAQADMPPMPEFPESEWRMGEPDHIVTFDAFTVTADGPDQFADLVVPVGLEKDTWVKAIEILPSAREVNHHVIVFQSDGSDADPQGWLGAWAAGGEPMIFPENTGRLLKAGQNIVGDMHYHPSGTEMTDQTRVGFYFADESKMEKELVNLWVLNVDFAIPPHAEKYVVEASYEFPQDSLLYSFTPHMHYRGKDFTYKATYPDGSDEVLFRAVDYDFNWQTHYELEEPIHVPAGTVLECVATYDNSENNPLNPDPTITVTFGDESYDEMMIGFLDYVVVDGMSPMPVEELMNREIAEWAEADPTSTYDATLVAGHHKMRLLFQLPKAGEGKMAMDVIGSLQTAPTEGLTWEGNNFETKISIPGEGPVKLVGSIEEPTGELTARVHFDNGFKLPVTGTRVN